MERKTFSCTQTVPHTIGMEIPNFNPIIDMHTIKNVYELEDLEYHYFQENLANGGVECFALTIDRMNIRRGALTAILGRSGSGKTTLLSILGLLRQPKQGRFILNLKIDGNNKAWTSNEIWSHKTLAESLRGRHLGFALQNGELLPYLSIRENIEFPLKVGGMPLEQIKERVSRWVHRLYTKEEHPDKLSEKSPLNVSKGQYQRCAVGRAFIHDPEVILSDEPTGNLDVKAADTIIGFMKDFVRGNDRSVVLATHDLDLSVEYADEIWVLKSGKIVAHFSKNHGNGWPSKAELGGTLS